MQGIDGIIKFQKDRALDKKEFNNSNEQINIIEELLEASGYDAPKENRELLKEKFEHFIEISRMDNLIEPVEGMTTEDIVDAYNDIIVFAVGAIMKLGYNPKLTIKEVSKEINSREGEMVNGKFEKFLTDEAKQKWYKANYSTCKL